MTKEDVLYLTRNTLTLGMYDNVVLTNALVMGLQELKTEWINPDKDIMKMFNMMYAFWVVCMLVGAFLNTITLGIVKWVTTIIGFEHPEATLIARFGYRDYLIRKFFNMDPRWFRKEKRVEALEIAMKS